MAVSGKVLFRTDASIQIGSGHVMRCLTLAEALRQQGGNCRFICREHPGNLIDIIRNRGFLVETLPCGDARGGGSRSAKSDDLPAHADWLGCDWETDAQQSLQALSSLAPDWLVLDHYALDARWEKIVKPYCRHMMVIDDLADRAHVCDLLLDQNLGRNEQDYRDLVPEYCRLMVGSRYALLRPEFARLRDYSLKRREMPHLGHVLITMGGVDKDNATSRVLETLKRCSLPGVCRISVIMGGAAPWLDVVRQLAACMPWPTEVAVNVTDMAQRMADADLAIGAAGGTSWERCSLGLPTLLVVLADNQWAGARALADAKAALLVGDMDDIATQLPESLENLLAGHGLSTIGSNASRIADGKGVERVIANLENIDVR